MQMYHPESVSTRSLNNPLSLQSDSNLGEKRERAEKAKEYKQTTQYNERSAFFILSHQLMQPVMSPCRSVETGVVRVLYVDCLRSQTLVSAHRAWPTWKRNVDA